MEDLFEKLGKTLGDTVESLGKKAENTLDIQKLKGQISTMKRANERDLMDMGKIIYERFEKGVLTDTEFLAYCESIERREEDMEACEQEISRIKGE